MSESSETLKSMLIGGEWVAQQDAAFVPAIDPTFIPQLVQVAKEDTTTAEFVLSKSVLPLYVPPKGFLVVFPKEVSQDPDGFDIFIQYARIERTAGVGPLVQ